MGQHSKGWLAAPVELKAAERPGDLPSGGYKIAFRLGVEQAGKLRACDDFKHGLTNQACRARTPIELVSWGRLSQLRRTFAKDGRDRALFTADHEAASKQLPLGPADQLYAIVALRCPTSGIWYGFRSRALVCGSAAAVVHYNVFPRLITAISNRTFGVPLISFFEDFAALPPRLLARKGMAAFTGFCELFGRLKSAKSEIGPEVTFAGLLGTYSAKEADFVLRNCLQAEKEKARPAPVLSYLVQGWISSHRLEKLVGRLTFSQTSLFGKFARAHLRPLYRKLYRRVYNSALSAEERGLVPCGGTRRSSPFPHVYVGHYRRNSTGPFTRTRLPTRRAYALCSSTRERLKPVWAPTWRPSFVRGRSCLNRLV